MNGVTMATKFNVLWMAESSHVNNL